MTNATQAQVTEAQLDAFLAICQAPIDAHFAKAYPSLTPTRLSYELGKRYARIIATTDGGKGQRSAWGFVDLATGDLYKSASWKGPAKNFPRGNLHTLTVSKWESGGIC